jgi:hypothetical protein
MIGTGFTIREYRASRRAKSAIFYHMPGKSPKQHADADKGSFPTCGLVFSARSTRIKASMDALIRG